MNIQQNVLRIQHRIEAACQQAGRASNTVRLLAVSKTKSVAEIRPHSRRAKVHSAKITFKKAWIKFNISKRKVFNWNGILSARYNPTKPVWSRNISIGCKP